MAQGTAILFNEYSEELARGTHAWGTHVFKIALITTLPVVGQTTPTLSDFTEVSGGSYASVTATVAISRVAGQTTIDITNNPIWAQDGSGPTNIVAALIYNNTDASKKAIGAIDMTTDGGLTPVSQRAGDVSLTFNASGFTTVGQHVAGITPNEGQSYIAQAVYKKLGLDLVIGLFTNSSGLGVTSVWGQITQPSGGGYAEKALSSSTFSVAPGGVATYPKQTWTASGGSMSPAIYGYYIRTVEATPRLVHFEFNTGPRVVTDGDVYSVDLSTDTETG